MTHPNDYKRQPHGAQSCKDASANGRPSCIMTSCFQCSPTERWEWQQSFRLDRSNSTKTLREELLERQFGSCVNIMLVILLSYLLFQGLRDRTGGFFMLSYPLDSSYGIGPQDLKLVLGFMTFFAAARVAVMDYVLKPLAVKLRVSKPSTPTRFADHLLHDILVLGTEDLHRQHSNRNPRGS
jgi:acyl-CoA-dependent ceramide synthase